MVTRRRPDPLRQRIKRGVDVPHAFRRRGLPNEFLAHRQRNAQICFRFSFPKISKFRIGPRIGWRKDYSGQRFGRLVAVSFVGRKHHNAVWLFRCDCGSEAAASISNVIHKDLPTRSWRLCFGSRTEMKNPRSERNAPRVPTAAGL